MGLLKLNSYHQMERLHVTVAPDDCEHGESRTKQRKTFRVRKRRWQGPRLIVLSTILSLCYLSALVITNPNQASGSNVHAKSLFFDTDSRTLHRRLLSSSTTVGATTSGNSNATTASPTTTTAGGFDYPPDLFTTEQLKQGAVILHFLGVIYRFVAVAIVCDEFFVPSLEVITEKLQLSEDVAGATFMAAGGSAPELFTSFIGTFISGDNVGIGTIVGSAVFNILFVIGMCAVFSKSVLSLTWWPLFRDVTFYSISLIVLIATFNDGKIHWWESVLLLLCYAAYVTFMKFNQNVENAVKTKLMKNKVTTVRSTDNLIAEQKMQRRCSVPMLHAGGNKFRQGVLQLMIHTIDPLGEAKVQEKAIQMHAVASLKVLMNPENGVQEPNHNSKNGSITAISNGQLQTETPRNHSADSTQTTLAVTGGNNDEQEVVSQRTVNSVFVTSTNTPPPTAQYPEINSVSSDTKSQKEELETENEPLDISWPDTWRKRIVYIIIFPILFPLWLFLPDVRRPEKRKFFPVTFIGSILSIAVFSYAMNWWANVVGVTAGIQPEVMGLTILAAGTSVPDLITSVIVAKKGYGDMAVSSSVGSNIFDVTMGLPLPWLIWTLSHSLLPITVKSSGLFCSIVLLFIMLLLVIICIAAFRWKMNKAMGGVMFLLYLVFLAVAVLLELKILICPVGG